MLPIGANSRQNIINFSEIVVIAILFLFALFLAFPGKSEISKRIDQDKKNSKVSLIYMKKVLERGVLTNKQKLSLADIYINLGKYKEADSILLEVMSSSKIKLQAYKKHIDLLISNQIFDSLQIVLKQDLDSFVVYSNNLNELEDILNKLKYISIYPQKIYLIDKILTLENNENRKLEYLRLKYKIFMAHSRYNRAYNTLSAIYEIDKNKKNYYNQLYNFYVMSGDISSAISVKQKLIYEFGEKNLKSLKSLLNLYAMSKQFNNAELFIEKEYNYFINNFDFAYNIILQSGNKRIEKRFLKFVFLNDKNLNLFKYRKLANLSLAIGEYDIAYNILIEMIQLKMDKKSINKLIDLAIWKGYDIDTNLFYALYPKMNSIDEKNKVLNYLIKKEDYNFASNLILIDIKNNYYQTLDIYEYINEILGEPEKTAYIYEDLYYRTGNYSFLKKSALINYKIGNVDKSYSQLLILHDNKKLDLETVLLLSNISYIKKRGIKKIYEILKSVKVDTNDTLKYVYYKNLNNLAWLNRDNEESFKISKYLINSNHYTPDEIEIVASLFKENGDLDSSAFYYKLGWQKYHLKYMFINYFDILITKNSNLDTIFDNLNKDELSLIKNREIFYYIKGSIALKKGDLTNFKDIYLEGLKKFPKSKFIQSNYAFGLSKMGDYKSLKYFLYNNINNNRNMLDKSSLSSLFLSMGYVDRALYYILQDSIYSNSDKLLLYTNIKKQQGFETSKIKQLIYKNLLKEHKESYKRLQLLLLSFNKYNSEQLLDLFKKSKLSSVDSVNFLISYFYQKKNIEGLQQLYNQNIIARKSIKTLDVDYNNFVNLIKNSNSDEDRFISNEDYISAKSSNYSYDKNILFEKISKNSANRQITNDYIQSILNYSNLIDINSSILFTKYYKFYENSVSYKMKVFNSAYILSQFSNYYDINNKTYSMNLNLVKQNNNKTIDAGIRVTNNRVGYSFNYEQTLSKYFGYAIDLKYRDKNREFYYLYMNGDKNSVSLNLKSAILGYNISTLFEQNINFFKNSYVGKSSNLLFNISKNLNILKGDNAFLNINYNQYNDWSLNQINSSFSGTTIFTPTNYTSIGFGYSYSAKKYSKYFTPSFTLSSSFDNNLQNYSNLIVGINRTIFGLDQIYINGELGLNPQINSSLYYYLSAKYSYIF